MKKSQTVAARDGCVVATDPLVGMLDAFVGEWEKTRPKSEGHRAGNRPGGPRPIRAVEWLSSESGVSEYMIRDVMNGNRSQVDLGIADALVAAVGAPEAFYDGTLIVSGCCGGSARREVDRDGETEHRDQ